MYKHPQSYRAVLSDLRKEQEELKIQREEESKKIIDNKSDNIFKNYIINLSKENLDSIPDILLFKKKNIDEYYSYEIPNTEVKQNKRKTDICKKVKETFIYVFPERLIDDDFLTGYFISKTLININKNVIKLFIAGMTNNSMMHGIIDGLNKTSVDFYGCDKRPSRIYSNKYFNGVTKRCDVNDINSAVSINIELCERFPINVFDIFISDICQKDASSVLSSFMIHHSLVMRNGIILLRLPDDWTEFYTAMASIIMFFVYHYEVVKVIKIPWGIKSRSYIYLSFPRCEINQKKKANIISYIKELQANKNLPLLASSVFENENNETEQKILEEINNVHCHIQSFEEQIDEKIIMKFWTDLIK